MDSIACRVTKNNAASLARFFIDVINTGKRYADQIEIGASFDYDAGKQPVAQQQDVSIPDNLKQRRIGQASCIANEKAMAALSKEFLKLGSDRCF